MQCWKLKIFGITVCFMATYINITAKDMELFLEAQGFKPMSLPGTVELVWGKRVDQGGTQLSLRVYSGIDPSGNSREVGADAIRVNLFTRLPDGKIVKVSGSKRVHRVAGWQKNLQVRLDKWGDDLRTCPDCGMPLVVRNGKNGEFLGCTGYPNCHHSENLSE